MSRFGWFKRPQQPAPTPPTLTPEQRGPTTIYHAGVTTQLPFQWKRATGPDTEPGSEEYRNAVLPEQLFITPRRFVRRVTPEELHAQLAGIAEHYRAALATKFGSALQSEPHDIRTGGDQMELRLLARAPDFQIALLHRADPGRVVSMSLYRYLDSSKLDLREYAANIFDLVQFEPTAP